MQPGVNFYSRDRYAGRLHSGFSESVDDPDDQDNEKDADKYGRIKTGFKNSLNNFTGTKEEYCG